LFVKTRGLGPGFFCVAPSKIEDVFQRHTVLFETVQYFGQALNANKVNRAFSTARRSNQEWLDGFYENLSVKPQVLTRLRRILRESRTFVSIEKGRMSPFLLDKPESNCKTGP